MLRKYIRVCSFTAFSLALASCQTTTKLADPGTTGGLVKVGSPRVTNRASLLNDRNDQVAWLREQLNNVDEAHFGYQGTADFSQFYGNFSKTSVASDVKKELGKIARPSIKSDKDGDGKTTDTTITTDTSAPQTPSSSNAPKLTPSKLDTVNTSEASPIDLFRDKLAYREEVRAEIIETALDDRHDLNGNTLYRLSFPVTVIPEGDTGSWAMVNLTLSPISSQNQDFRKKITRKFTQGVQTYLRELTNRFLSGNLTARERKELLDLAITEHFFTSKNNTSQYLDVSSSEDPIEAYLSSILEKDPTWSAEATEQFGNKVVSAERVVKANMDGAKRKLASLMVFARIFDEEGNQSRFDAKPDCRNGGCTIKVNSMTATALSQTEKNRLWAYAITPKEQVQRISDVAARRNVSQHMFQISALLGAVDIGSAAAFVKDSLNMMQAVRRQPLIVGFANQDKCNNDTACAKAGWVIGPKFKISPKGDKVAFRHIVQQNTVTLDLSAPATLTDFKITVSTCWLPSSDGTLNTCDTPQVTEYFINLSGDLDQVIAKLSPTLTTASVNNPHKDVIGKVLMEGEVGRLIIKGQNLWRNAVVSVGTQLSKKITVLPDMDAIAVEFGEIEPPKDFDHTSGTMVPLNIWTSRGNQFLGEVKILPSSKTTASVSNLALQAPERFYKNKPVRIVITNGEVNRRATAYKMKMRPDLVLKANTSETTVVDLIQNGKILQADFSKVACNKCANGIPVNFAYSQTSNRHGFEETVAVDGRSIFYNAEDDAKAKIQSNTYKVDKNPEINITHPINVTAAYQGFDPNTATLKAATANNETLAISKNAPCSIKANAYTCKYTLKPTDQLTQAVQKGNITYSFKLDGPNPPPLEGTITFTK